MGDSMRIGRFYVRRKGQPDYMLKFLNIFDVDRIVVGQCETILAIRCDHDADRLEVIAICDKFDMIDPSKLRDHSSIPPYSWWFTHRSGGNYEAVAVREYDKMEFPGEWNARRFLDRLAAPDASASDDGPDVGPGSA